MAENDADRVLKSACKKFEEQIQGLVPLFKSVLEGAILEARDTNLSLTRRWNALEQAQGALAEYHALAPAVYKPVFPKRDRWKPLAYQARAKVAQSMN